MRGQTERQTAGKELVTTDRPDEIAALTLAAVVANIGSLTPSNLIVRPFRALLLTSTLPAYSKSQKHPVAYYRIGRTSRPVKGKSEISFPVGFSCA